MATTGDLRSLLGPANFNQIPSHVAGVLQELWTKTSDNLRLKEEKVRVEGEQKVAELQAVVEELNGKLGTFTQETEKGETALQHYREQAASSSATASRLTEELGTASAERDDFRRQLFAAKAEKDDMAGLAERRQQEVERVAGEIKALTDQVTQAQTAKCEAMVRVEEVEGRERAIEHREKRVEEERAMMQSQVQLLQTELDARCEEVLAAKRDAGKRLAEVTQDLAERSEEAEAAARREQVVRDEANQQRARAEQLAERLREARNSEGKMEENFRAELAAQTRLATLYQEHSKEGNAKTEELASAVKELQGLLAEADKKYNKVEAESKEAKIKQEEVLAKKEETIGALKKELEAGNKLIKTMREKGLSEASIECLSPSAAQASKLLKSGVTVTGIYSQMVGLGEELQAEKAETQRLNLYIEQILHEIEERAPLLKQQREDYEKAVAAVGGLTESLESAREEVELRRSEAEEARRRLAGVERDRDRQAQQASDLGRQVTTLVREVEASRGGAKSSLMDTSSQPVDTSNVNSLIEGRLLTFRDVAELQERNIELVAVVRELSAQHEAQESSLVEEKTAELRQELDTAMRQVEELRAARARQEVMVENIIQQRDMYKSMASGPGAITTSPAHAKAGDAAKEARLTKELEEVKKDFAEYKVEKATNYKMLNDQVDKMREELTEARTKAAKLGSQEEYNTERFKIAAATNESLKRQMKLLEDRNRQLDKISGKHEESVTALREQLLESHQKQSKAEVEADRLKLENSHLTASQTRLLTERDAMLKDRGVASRIEANMAQIQLNLERRDEESKLRLERMCEEQQKEVDLLRRKVDMEQEQYRESVRTWERTNNDLREKADCAEAREKAVLEQMASQSETIGTMKDELKDAQEQLQLAESRLAGRGLGKQASVVDTGLGGEGGQKSRLRDVELLMAQTKQELKARTQELNEAKKRIEEFKGISEAAEKRMVESSKTLGEFKDQLEAKLKKAEEEKEAAEKKATECVTDAAQLKQKVALLENEAGATGGDWREKLRKATSDLEELQAAFTSSQTVASEAKSQAERMEVEAREAQEKYEREMMLHAKDIEALNKLKSEIRDKKVDMGEIENEKKKMNSKMAELAEEHSKEVAKIRAEAESLAAQVEAMTGENAALHRQVETATQQMNDMAAAGLNTSNLNSSSTKENLDVSREEGSSQELVAVIKYLRQEKQILTSRLEVVAAEAARTASQLQHQQHLTEDAEAALARHVEKESGAVLSATKHGELIRKVETLSAVTDSNRMLREAKEKLEKMVEESNAKASSAQAALAPMETKVKDYEERVANLVVEKAVLQKEADEWKKRSDQLVEKSFKINPEELKKLQEEKIKLTRMVQSLTAAKKQLDTKVIAITTELETSKKTATQAQEEAKKQQLELQTKAKEHQIMQQQSLSAKNIQANLQSNVNALKKKVEEMEKAKTEMTNAMQAAANNHRMEMESLKKNTEGAMGEELTKARRELEAANQANTAKGTEIETLKSQITQKEEEVGKEKNTVRQLKSIGRKFREQKEEAEKKVLALEEEKKKLEEEMAKKASDAPSGTISPTQGDDETHKLLEESMERISTLEADNEKLKTENEELQKTSALKEDRAKTVLKTARAKIQKSEDEKKKLELELQQIGQASAAGSSEEQDLRLKAIMSQLKSTKDDKEKLESDLFAAQQEKERLEEQVKNLERERQEAQTESRGERPKPVAVAGVVQQQEREKAAPRKQQQPQAHIQPHLRTAHTPRDEHRPTQTASIRPMAQRATSQAVVLPTSQMSPGQPEVATVQPTVSVSPSVSSATGSSGSGNQQVPSTSQPGNQQQAGGSQQQAPGLLLDPTAAEFYPTARSASSEAVVIELEDASMPRAVVIPRQDQPQASTSGPMASSGSSSGPSTGPSTSGATGSASPSAPTTASVPPTLKRPREMVADSDSQSSSEGALGGSASVPGMQKKARTISSTEGLNLQVSSGASLMVGVEEEQGISGSGEVESDSSMQMVEPGEERREVGSSSQFFASEVGTSGEVAACSGVTTSTQEEEEVLDSEQEEGEDEVEVSEDMEDGEVNDDMEPENLVDDEESEVDAGQEAEIEIDEAAVGTSEDEGEVVDGGEEQMGNVASVEDNSSEPSSSTGTRHRTTGQAFASASQGLSGYEVETGGDSVVPSTPNLPLARRTDGFAEAVSSPQVPVSEHFVFAQSGSSGGASGADLIVTSSNSGLAGQEGLDRTAVDIQGLFATGAGRAPSAAGQPEQEEEESQEAEEVQVEDSEEGGVSSVVSSTEQQASRGRSLNRRAPIVWDTGAGGGTTSTSPQRAPANVAAAALRGVAGRGGPTARRSRGGVPKRGGAL